MPRQRPGISTTRPARIALVVHPTRPITGALGTLERWAAEQGLDVVQIRIGPTHREVAPHAAPAPGDLVLALGGDGTVLTALRAAARVDAPVLGVACGSLGALTAVDADRLEHALHRAQSGDWTPFRLPALAIAPAQGDGEWAVNDFVVVRRRAGQALVDVYVDAELYVRLAGDGLIVATALGSSAYSMAAGGPLLAPGGLAMVCTPLAMHGGNAPPLVVPPTATVRVVVHPSFAGFDVEVDGQSSPLQALEYHVTLHAEKATLVSFDSRGLGGLAALRRRRLIMDSPRVLARDDRTSRA